jgi:hypothetical protein
MTSAQVEYYRSNLDPNSYLHFKSGNPGRNSSTAAGAAMLPVASTAMPHEAGAASPSQPYGPLAGRFSALSHSPHRLEMPSAARFDSAQLVEEHTQSMSTPLRKIPTTPKIMNDGPQLNVNSTLKQTKTK